MPMANKHKRYNAGDIVKSFNWLGHNGHGYTELVALHKDYEPGRGNWQKNLKKGRLPKIWYTRNASTAVAFVKKYHQEHMTCFGVNPRPHPLKTEQGFNRSAKDADIETVINFYLDIDCLASDPSDEQLADIGIFLIKTDEYFQDLGLNRPVTAFSGRGYHILFSPSLIYVDSHPDVKDKLGRFRRLFLEQFERDLAGLEARVDNTMDLKRLEKVPGTRKPTAKYISEFRGNERQEDKNLTDYLLSLPADERPLSEINLAVAEQMPENFQRLLERDGILRSLWNGLGKSTGDVSKSGYDFSVIRYALKRGITDIADLSTILAHRPDGCVRAGGKGDKYIRTTIANAIKY